MKKYIKTVVFMVISILICGVVLSDPARAQMDTDIFKEKIDRSIKFETAEDIYDYFEYRIKWDDLDWIQLVQESKNILRTRLNDDILVKTKDRAIDISDIFEAKNNATYIKFSNENDYVELDFNLFKRIYYSDLDSDDDSDHIISSCI